MCTKVCTLWFIAAPLRICSQNITESIVNGSVGIITRFAPLKPTKPDDVWPEVRFDNGEVMVMGPVKFEHENDKGQMEARRYQVLSCFVALDLPASKFQMNKVPLILAWALTASLTLLVCYFRC
jgi:hypothetical protein